MAILYSFAARCLFGVVFALIHHETSNPQGMVSLLSLPLASHGYCDVFFEGNFLKVYVSGQTDVRSGTSMTIRVA